MLEAASRHALLNRYPYYLVACAVPLYLLHTVLYAGEIPRDFAITSAVLAVVLLVEMLLGRHLMTFTMRGAVYVAIVFSTYLASRDQTLGTTGPYEYAFFIVLVLAVILTMKFASSVRFHTTPMDYLILSGVVVAAVFGQGQIAVTEVSLLIVKAVLLLYASEVIIDRVQSRWNLLNLAALFTLGLIAMKGLMLW
jgi:hypothetical protein